MAIRDEDQFLVNRQTKSYKTPASSLGEYLITGGGGSGGGGACDPNQPNPCGPGFECVPDGNGDGICVQIPCNPVTGCPGQLVCYNGFCYEKCFENPDAGVNGCLPGYECYAPPGGGPSICVPEGGGGGGLNPCTGDDDCPFPFECDGGYCKPQTCFTDSDCPADSLCVDGHCYEVCDEYKACAEGFVCVDGVCRPIGGIDGGGGSGGGGGAVIGDGRLIFRDSSNVTHRVFSANQHPDTVIDFNGSAIDEGGGNWTINFGGLWEETNGGADIRPIKADKNIIPNGIASVGTKTQPWSNIYTNDLHLSNQGSKNDVDGTWGDWTIQEGEDDLYLLNNRTGKKYAFVLKPID